MERESGIGILGIGSYVPERVVSNTEVARAAGLNEHWIFERTGVERRYAAHTHTTASDLAAPAASRALAEAGATPEEVTLLLVATMTPDELTPSTACRLQTKIGAENAVAFDLNAACSGYLFGLGVAHDWLLSRGPAGIALVVGVELLSKFTDPADWTTSALLGDGAGATVVGRVCDGHGIRALHFGSDGSRGDAVHIPGGGSRRPACHESVDDSSHTVHMDGRGIREFTRTVFPYLIERGLDGNSLEDLALLISHQPNPVLFRKVVAEAGIAEEKILFTGHSVGNLGGASVPYALAQAAAHNRLPRGGIVLLTAFGGGLTWASVLMRWDGHCSGTSG